MPDPVAATALHVLPNADIAQPVQLLDPMSAELMPYSDGRPWQQNVVTEEVLSHIQSIMVGVFEVGRRLLWGKSILPHGQFEAWVTLDLGLSVRTSQQYMQVSRFLVDHPGVLKPASRAGVKKLLLLSSLPEELQAQVEETGLLAEVPLSQLETTPYSVLKGMVQRLTSELEELKEESATTQNKLRRAQDRLMEESDPDEFCRRGRVSEAKKAIEDALHKWARPMDDLAGSWDELAPATRAELVAYCEWLRAFATHEAARLEAIAEQITPGDYGQILREAKFLLAGHAHQLDESRELPFAAAMGREG